MNPGYHRSTMKRTGTRDFTPMRYCKGCPVMETGFFSALNGKSKAAISCLMEYGHYEPRQILYQEGNSAARVYAIKSGYVKTFRTHPLGKNQVIQVAKAGDVLNLESIRGGRCTVTAEVLAKAEICFLEVQRLLESARLNSPLALEIIQLMSASIVQSQQRILDFGTRDAKARLARFLLDLRPDRLSSEREPENGAVDFRLPLTRHEIADLIGVRLETISRLFLFLKERGIIEADRRFVKILDIPRLRDLAR